MAFLWVQQWLPLPVALGHQMGDLPPGSRPQPSSDSTATDLTHNGTPSFSSVYKPPDHSLSFYPHPNLLSPTQLRSDFPPPAHPMIPQYREHNAPFMNMTSMAAALPAHALFGTASMNPHSPSRSPSAVTYPPGRMANSAAYAPAFAPNTYPNYMPVQGPQAGRHSAYGGHQPAAGVGQTPFQSFPPPPPPPPFIYVPSPYESHGSFAPTYTPQALEGQTGYARRTSLANAADTPRAHGSFSRTRTTQGALAMVQPSMGTSHAMPFVAGSGPSSAHFTSAPRGPPRKPKQSGHALWVGNLPIGSTVLALKDHFSREATKDIESLFLISKSNCAFVNYRTEASCTAAMQRFHDSRFHGVRLVCRLRRTPVSSQGVPAGPSAMVDGGQSQHALPPASPEREGAVEDGDDDNARVSAPQRSEDGPGLEDVHGPKDVSNRYFIVKSLTLQDLELSVRNRIWATQSHNEELLNEAFKSAKNVYLIFSANKSGEYFGYARMASSILQDGAQLAGVPLQTETVLDTSNAPKSIPTPATEWAPRGRIIDDSARGTIFWEAQSPDLEDEEEKEAKVGDEAAEAEAELVNDSDNAAAMQSWGKPFRIEWLSTQRLPFNRTRGMRNPWNSNREVKVARDGTELEPSVGERLIHLFHRPGAPTTGVLMPSVVFGGPSVPPPPRF